MQKENSYVAVTYIPGAFLHANMDEEVHMLLEGTIAELISSQNYTGNVYGRTKITNHSALPMIC